MIWITKQEGEHGHAKVVGKRGVIPKSVKLKDDIVDNELGACSGSYAATDMIIIELPLNCMQNLLEHTI